MANSVSEAIYYLVVPGGDCWHIWSAVAEDMWEGFILLTVTTGRTCVRPAVLYSIDGKAVEASAVNESPVFESHIEACEVPVRAISKFVV